MPIDPEELVGPLVTGWPLDGVAANWIMNLRTGQFGELRLRQGFSELVRLFNFHDGREPMRPRGPAAVRLRIGFEDDDEPPNDDDADMEFVVDVELDWSELVESGAGASPATRRPLVLLPSREPVPCSDLSLYDVEEVLGKSSGEAVLEERPEERALEWLRDGFFITGHTEGGILTAIGFSSLGLDGTPPLRLVQCGTLLTEH